MTISTGAADNLLPLTLRADNARYFPDLSTYLILRRSHILNTHVQRHLHELLLFCRSVRLHAENLSVNKPFPLTPITLLHAGGAAGIVLEREAGQPMHHQWLNPGTQFAQCSNPIAPGQRILGQQFDRPLPVILADTHLPEKSAVTQCCPFLRHAHRSHDIRSG